MRTLLQILLITLTAVSIVSSAGETKNAPACCQKTLEAGSPLPDRSIYQVTSTWTNDEAKTIRLEHLRGKPQVIVMFFANCAYACPLLVYNMQQIESALPEESRSKVGFTLISFDTERDSPRTLAEYRKRRELDDQRWTLLCGKPDDVLEISALLGVRFKKDAKGQFSHSNIITVLNSEGEVVKQQVGLNSNPKAVTETLQQLLVTPHQR